MVELTKYEVNKIKAHPDKYFLLLNTFKENCQRIVGNETTTTGNMKNSWKLKKMIT